MHIAIDKGAEKLTKGGAGGEAKFKDDEDGTRGPPIMTDLDVEDAWVGSTLGGLLEVEAVIRRDIGWLDYALDVADNKGLRGLRGMRIVTALTW